MIHSWWTFAFCALKFFFSATIRSSCHPDYTRKKMYLHIHGSQRMNGCFCAPLYFSIATIVHIKRKITHKYDNHRANSSGINMFHFGTFVHNLYCNLSKLFVASEGAVWSLIKCLKWCHLTQHQLGLKLQVRKWKISDCMLSYQIPAACSLSQRPMGASKPLIL